MKLWLTPDRSVLNEVAGIQARLGADCAVEITLVDNIAPEASGTHRYVVSLVKLPF